MYWRNSNFQYVHFIFGACHTPIEAHRKCVEAIEDRELAIFESEKNPIDSDDPPGRQYSKVIAQAKQELEFLNNCKAQIESYIGHTPTIEDYQNNQKLEWKLELATRIENNLMCTGTIPPDQFAAMRQHPDFPELLEHLNSFKSQLIENKNINILGPTWKTELGLLENKTNS